MTRKTRPCTVRPAHYPGTAARHSSRQFRRCLVLGVALLVLGGCATTKKQASFEPPVFPPPPAQGRFIYERTLKFSTDIEPPGRMARLREFAVGRTDEMRGLVKPFDVAVYQGRVYVSDSVQSKIILFDLSEKRYREFGTEKPGLLVKPLGLDISNDGELYVADIAARRVMVYDLDGHFRRAIGNKDLLQRPADVALNPAGDRLYVVDVGGVDSKRHQVQVFDPHSGQLLQTIGHRGTGPGEFNLPLQATVTTDGMLFVVDKGNFRVQAFYPDGRYAYTFGSLGRFPGQFFSPKGISSDHDGNLYVVDTAFGNFQIFNHEGKLLLYIGDRGQLGGPAKYLLPAGIDVDNDGRIYVVDQYFRKVDVFRPLSPDATGMSTRATPAQ